MMGIEPMTSSLPRKRSTPELHRPHNLENCSLTSPAVEKFLETEHLNTSSSPYPPVILTTLSGKRDSNSRPQPWKGCALPTELFPHIIKELFSNISCTVEKHTFDNAHTYHHSQNFNSQNSTLKTQLSKLNSQNSKLILWGEEDSNLRRHLPADLQSAPVGHFGISPYLTVKSSSYF